MLTERPKPREPFAADAFTEAAARCRRAGTADPMLLELANALFGVQRRLFEDLGRHGAENIDRADWLKQAAPAVAAAVTANSPSAPEGLKAMKDLLEGTSLDAGLAAAGGDARALKQLSSESAIDGTVLQFVLRQAMQPYFSQACVPPEDASVPYPARQTCPACGGRPLMARHALPDGHRFLGCSVCGREWAYPRVACPACGETDHHRLEVMYVPGAEGHRVYLCSACRRYTKAADERLLGGPAYLPLEDLITLHLDELARKRGYTPVDETGPVPQDEEQKRFH